MAEQAIRIPLEEVESSIFSHVGYDARRSILALRFKSGAIFHHGSVPHDVATEFLSALSLGTFYNANIKGKFPGQKMTGECSKCGDTGWIGDRCLDCGCAEYAAPIRHALVVDHPSSVSKRSRMAECGQYFAPAEFARHADGVTCATCLHVLAEQSAMEI